MFLDTRMGNAHEYFWNRPDDWPMRVHTAYLKSVGFFARIISKGSVEDKNFRGTGFVVSVPSTTLSVRHHVVVTAKHVADQLALGGDWIFRLATKEGDGFADIRSNQDHKWYFHHAEKETVDVAVSPILLPQGIHYGAIRVECFLTDDQIKEQIVGPGDEVFTVGLFTKIKPHLKNRPIVRTGNVALIPEPGERVSGVNFRDHTSPAEVYLIEARSIGGLSGSPVFVRSTVRLTAPVTRNGMTRPEVCRLPGDSFLFGLARSHWDILPEDRDDPNPRGPDTANPNAVNMGIAVVMPAKKIRDIIYCQELVEHRRRIDERLVMEQGTDTLDADMSDED
jgi:hypothetical protein